MSGLMIAFWWLFFSVAAGVTASYRFNRSGMGYFALGLFLCPLVAFVWMFALGPKRPDDEQQKKSVDWSKIDWSGNAGEKP